MSIPYIIFIEGLLYIVLLGGLSLLKREGLSAQFAYESLAITLLVGGLAFINPTLVNPILFLVVLYLITMRVRLLIDLGTLFARQGRLERGDWFYRLAARLKPDAASQLILQLNQGVNTLQQGQSDEAVSILKGILQQSGKGYLGPKYESAVHYNLGVAYLRKKMDAQAIVEFNAVIETWPASEYARRARNILEQRHRKPD
jgi:hypothetical protein